MNERAQSNASQLLQFIVLALIVPLLCIDAAWDGTADREHVSDLWGHRGERWSPTSRILDVSNAGFEASSNPKPPGASAAGTRTQLALGLWEPNYPILRHRRYHSVKKDFRKSIHGS